VFARPTADHVWLGPSQQAALSQLSRPATIRAIVGPASSGKTTLLHHLGSKLYANAAILHCRGPKDEASAVLASLLMSADLAPWDLSEIEQRNLLTVFVAQRRSQNRPVVLLLDDAHHLTGGALEEIERLVAFKVDRKPAVELLLAGPPSVAAYWRDAQQRLGTGELIVHALSPASHEDVVGYLDWRLRQFEIQHFMTSMAAQMIARLSGGRYAAANVLCQMSLLVLRQLSLDRADARVVRQAVATLVARQHAKLDGERPPGAEHRLDAPPQGYLVVSRSGKVLTRVTLGQRTLLGRSEHNDVCLPSPYLGRHHAVIVGTPEGYYLVDLNSVNGVLVNGRRMDRTVLCDEDVLTIGPFRLKVQLPEWIAQANPLPAEADPLADTALMPAPTVHNSVVWRVK
jgi:type II secretory pathway predicted ATPase ExeA